MLTPQLLMPKVARLSCLMGLIDDFSRQRVAASFAIASWWNVPFLVAQPLGVTVELSLKLPY